MGTPLIITHDIREQIRELVALAGANPVNAYALNERLDNPAEKARHMAQMTRQTMAIPLAYLVTFSIETGHGVGTCRHLSMSVQRPQRLPSPEGMWFVAQEFGFWGKSINDCAAIWEEKLEGHGVAINLLQPLSKLFLRYL